jgi:sporulation protein YlmC with PRC-barrel domain
LRRLEIGEDVLAPNGSRLGKVERMVVDEKAHTITHLVVDGRAVELSHFKDAGPDGLACDLDGERLEKQAPADEPPFAAPGEHWQAPPGYTLESFLGLAGALVGQAPYVPPVHANFGQIDDIHEIDGSPVWAGGEEIGHVSEVELDEHGQISALVLEGGVFGRPRRLPVSRVVRVAGNNVHTDLQPDEADALEPA